MKASVTADLNSVTARVQRPGNDVPQPSQVHPAEQGWDHILTGEYLVAAYLEDRMTTEAIAANVGTTARTVTIWLTAYGIPRRGHEPGVDNLLYVEELTATFLERRLRERASVKTIARGAGCTATAEGCSRETVLATAAVISPHPPAIPPDRARNGALCGP